MISRVPGFQSSRVKGFAGFEGLKVPRVPMVSRGCRANLFFGVSRDRSFQGITGPVFSLSPGGLEESSLPHVFRAFEFHCNSDVSVVSTFCGWRG